jgi:hypothetical protein
MIITLCGSARFEPWFHMWNEALSLSGHCVFALSSYPSLNAGEKDWYTEEQKKVLDAVHKGKIDASHAILVLNVFAYVGESTLSEIVHAKEHRKKLYSLESWGEGNGVGTNHFLHVRDAALRHIGRPHFGSPISTVHDGRPFYGPWELLPPGGVERTAIVARLKKREAEALGYLSQ